MGNSTNLGVLNVQSQSPQGAGALHASSTLQEWEITCRSLRGDAREGPLVKDTELQDIQEGFRLLDGGVWTWPDACCQGPPQGSGSDSK